MSTLARERLDENRVKLFGKTFGDWEVWYNCVDSPADNCPSWAIWDNPVDDDSVATYEAGGGFRFNTPSRGQLTINRSAPPLTRPWGSVISRRDETLRSGDGLTIEFRVQIKPPSGDDAFMCYYRRLDGFVLGVFLSPGRVGGGGYSQHRLGFAVDGQVSHDTLKSTNYRLVHPPRTDRVEVYINGKFAFKAKGNKAPVTSVHDFEKHSYIIVGGEKGNRTSHFTLDFVRYRRGGFAPNKEIGVPVYKRIPPLLPVPAKEPENWHDLTGTTPFLRVPKTTRPFVYPHEWVSAKPSRRTVVAGLLEGLTNRGDMTVELRAQVDPITEPRGFSMYFRDLTGTVGLLLSPNRVELSVGVKNIGFYRTVPIGIRGVPLDTSVIHTYRLVRQRNSFYVHLYIDDDPIPVLYDQHMDASTGGLVNVPPPVLLFGDTLNNWGKGRVVIHQLRWCNTAFAPST